MQTSLSHPQATFRPSPCGKLASRVIGRPRGLADRVTYHVVRGRPLLVIGEGIALVGDAVAIVGSTPWLRGRDDQSW